MLSVAALASLFCIVAVWGLYPALIGALAALIRRDADPAGARPAALPRVTAIVATRADAIGGAGARERPAAERVSGRAAGRGRGVRRARDGDCCPMWTRRGARAGAHRPRRRAGRQGVRAERGRARGARRRAGVRGQRPAIRHRRDRAAHAGGDAAGSGRGVGATRAGARRARARRSRSGCTGRSNAGCGAREAQVHSAVGVTGAIYAMRRALWTAAAGGAHPRRPVRADAARAVGTSRGLRGRRHARTRRATRPTRTSIAARCAR